VALSPYLLHTKPLGHTTVLQAVSAQGVSALLQPLDPPHCSQALTCTGPEPELLPPAQATHSN